MFNRFMLVYHSSFQSFWRMILDFSQPVNPKWRRDGLFCKVGGRYHNNDLCSPQKLARRDRLAFGPITQPQLGFAEELAVGTLEAPTKVYVNFGGTAYGKAHGEFVDNEWYLTAEQDVNAKWPSGKVLKIGVRAVEPADTVTPLTHNQLLSYVTNKIEGEQRAQQNQVVNKGGINSSASTQAQAEATQKLQQVANAAQSTTARTNVKVSSFSNPGNGPDGYQIGSDDTWNLG
jgi:hypothetical protein